MRRLARERDSGAGYTREGDGDWRLPTMKGSVVYAPGPVAGTPGELYIMWESFGEGCENGEARLAELLNVPEGKGKASRRSKTHALSNALVKDEYGTRPASFGRVGSMPWKVSANRLWTVDHLVSEVDPTWRTTSVRKGEGQAAQWARRAFTFDYREAERQIAVELAADEHEVAGTTEQAGESAGRASWSGMSRWPTVEDWEQGHSASEAAIELAGGAVRQQVAALNLADAKRSADEAAAARNHAPQQKPPAEKRAAQQAVTNRRTRVCQYPGMECGGCSRPFKIGEQMAPEAGGMVCPNARCAQMARGRLLQEIKEKMSAQRVSAGQVLASEKRDAQLAHRFSDARLGMVCKCMRGACNVTDEPRIFCAGARDAEGNRAPCGVGLHAKACGFISSYHARTSLFVCVDCRVKEMAPDSCGRQETLERYACRSMLLELSCGQATTAKSVAEFESLERKWLASLLDENGFGAEGVIEPRRSEESFMAFINWLVTDAGRARSFALIMRMAGIAMAQMNLRVLTAVPRVKLFIKEIAEQIGTEPEPCDIPSSLVVSTMLTRVLPKLCSTEYIHARSEVLFDGETAGGARLGEMTGGGDGHGVLANYSDIAWPIGSEQAMTETVNLHIEDSKTKYSRDMTYMGTTKGPLGIKGADHMRRLWALSGLEVNTVREDGMFVQRPNYYVLRLSLLGMERQGKTGVDRLVRLLRNTDEKVFKRSSAWIITYLNERYEGESGSEEIRYVNVAGGPKGCEDIQRAKAWLSEHGYEKFITRGEVSGPLLRATARGSPKVITHMPLKPGSSLAHRMLTCQRRWQKLTRSM